MLTPEKIIAQTEKWIMQVVIGCNFCPFALPEVKKGSVRYVVHNEQKVEAHLLQLMDEVQRLDEDETISTTLIIYPTSFSSFTAYLDFFELAEQLLANQDYDGIYQIATFHPDYCFAGEVSEDASNFTNRSPYPMLHLLRESSIDEALERYKHPEEIPQNNIAFARKKGATYMQQLRDSCF